jgi:hypothetical protein
MHGRGDPRVGLTPVDSTVSAQGKPHFHLRNGAEAHVYWLPRRCASKKWGMSSSLWQQLFRSFTDGILQFSTLPVFTHPR